MFSLYIFLCTYKHPSFQSLTMAPKSLLEIMKAKRAAKVIEEEAAKRAKELAKKKTKDAKTAHRMMKKEAERDFLRAIGGKSTLRRWKRADMF